MKHTRYLTALLSIMILSGFNETGTTGNTGAEKRNKIVKAWLIGDSTMTDYSAEEDYMSKRYPMTGWGQVFQSFLCSDSLYLVRHLFAADSVNVDNRARGGRSTRSFFEEGRWSEVYRNLQPGDIVMIQFGHNDASVAKGERYVSIPGYKEFLRLYVNQSREKGATPFLITPVARNYPWEAGSLKNTHGEYPEAMRTVARELGVYLIDLSQLSMTFFSTRGQDFVTTTYFMNLPSGVYEGYPDGSSDNTHFQPAGALEVANLVFQEMKRLTPIVPVKERLRKSAAKK